jgi:NAD(P)-dependent dehydrogenase (short-subunit alcohol dehydrogenase family)
MTASPSFRLDGKVALVTGGSKGLGRAMALGLAAAGADVVVASRKADACEDVAAEIRALGRRSVALPCHVGSWTECQDLVARTVAEMGGLDVLVNNAGIAPVPPSLDRVTEELFDKTIAVNLTGPLCLSGAASQHIGGGAGIRTPGHPGQRHRLWDVPHRLVRTVASLGGYGRGPGRPAPFGTHRLGRGDRRDGPLLGLGCLVLHDRRTAFARRRRGMTSEGSDARYS